MFEPQDYQYMARALEIAEKGLYSTHPNPRVGCVLVRDGKVIGEGYHIRAGEGHAEVNALAASNNEAQGATAYVTLEPCSHHGKTPPCADALLNAGVDRVVAAMQDPNPLVAGRGLARLEAAGIKVASGLMEAQAEQLNSGFIKRMRTGKPFVRLKIACSIDGRIAMASGESKWITGPAARQDVQKLRARSSAILTGAQTVRQDNPSLTVRPEECDLELQKKLLHFAQQPTRFIVSRFGRLSEDAHIFSVPGDTRLIVGDAAVVADKLRDRTVRLEADESGNISPETILGFLGQEGHNEVLVEAGGKLAGQFLSAGCVDELWIYMAPVILGSRALTGFDLNITTMRDKLQLELLESRVIGADTRLIYRPAINQ